MAEYIEREAALSCFHDWIDRRGDVHTPDEMEEYRALESLPAADVRPVVRGKWIGNKRHQSCSACGMTYCVPDGEVGALDMTHYNFCPNCGAKMEES